MMTREGFHFYEAFLDETPAENFSHDIQEMARPHVNLPFTVSEQC